MRHRKDLGKTATVSEKAEVETLQKALSSSLGMHSKFHELPLSSKTKHGLAKANFTDMTEIQQLSLQHSLRGLDILAAAKTGSGKTLAFLIPVLERLFIERWSKKDGLGALIISPTRELAVQIFDVLRSIGFRHDFSAGLVIGGKNIKQEQSSVGHMNILVATPGRLLQHLDQNSSLDCSNLQVLVLDEADRILDLGFSKTLKAILEFLPKSRQTLLFSATQTEDVKALASLSLRNAIPLSTFKADESKTPKSLKQSYFTCRPERKLEHLYAFLKANAKSKIIVFVSSCKQVRFVFEAFCKLQPGIPLLSLHGKQKQHQRMNIYSDFCRKENAALVCTDVAARGLDFPCVDWVFQLDCPEDAESYIHRVGRTARYNNEGSSLVLLLENESHLLQDLKKHNIAPAPIGKDNSIIRKNWNVTNSLASVVTQSTEIKYLAQKAITSYLRSLYLTRNKSGFNFDCFPLQEFARSFGLIHAPRISFARALGDKNASRDLSLDAASESDSTDDDFLKVTRRNHEIELEGLPSLTRAGKQSSSKRRARLSSMGSKKIRYEASDEEDLINGKPSPAHTVDDYVRQEARRLASVDTADKARLKQERREQKAALKEKQRRKEPEE